MSDLMALALKLAFLAFLWLFIIFAANVIRT
ncbi:MAG TPA: FHA domain-containing protein, partial [Propionibacteriaceae bacterium]|nr:FHA domain-containing protein [Propionibacteriaceae bacterium]